jgi:hypothetical protein
VEYIGVMRLSEYKAGVFVFLFIFFWFSRNKKTLVLQKHMNDMSWHGHSYMNSKPCSSGGGVPCRMDAARRRCSFAGRGAVRCPVADSESTWGVCSDATRVG